jgi:hypothetical protein
MAADGTKTVLRELKQESPTIRISGHKYKEAYSATVWALVEQVMEENDLLTRQLDTIESMVKVLKNQSELTTHEFREMRKAVEKQGANLKAIAHEAETLPSDKADDVDLKGE